MNKKKQDKSENLQDQIDEMKDELSQIKDFLMQISTEAQSIVFDECKIEKVIIHQHQDEEPTESEGK
jgi:hypothetical protein